MAGANTWPIVLVSYLYVKKDQTATNPKTAAALKADRSVGVGARVDFVHVWLLAQRRAACHGRWNWTF